MKVSWTQPCLTRTEESRVRKKLPYNYIWVEANRTICERDNCMFSSTYCVLSAWIVPGPADFLCLPTNSWATAERGDCWSCERYRYFRQRFERWHRRRHSPGEFAATATVSAARGRRRCCCLHPHPHFHCCYAWAKKLTNLEKTPKNGGCEWKRNSWANVVGFFPRYFCKS